MKWLRLLGITSAHVTAMAATDAVIAVLTIQGWVPTMLHPGAFDPTLIPPVPDHRQPESWVGLPGAPGDSDVALAQLPTSDPGSALSAQAQGDCEL